MGRRVITLFAATAIACAGLVGIGSGAGAATDGTPMGHLDSVGVSPALIRLNGWAGDPDGDAITILDVAYDGYFMSMAKTSWKRPDVQAALGLSATTGFKLVLPILPGPHNVCVYARNSGPTGFPYKTVGCVDVMVPGASAPGPHDPRGILDWLHSEFNQGTQNLDFRPIGWAFDPDTGGPITVRVRYLSRVSFFATDFDVTRDLSTGVARPDVQLMVPAAGPASGFNSAFQAGVFTGIEVFCAYAINVGPGSNHLIGCRTAIELTPP